MLSHPTHTEVLIFNAKLGFKVSLVPKFELAIYTEKQFKCAYRRSNRKTMSFLVSIQQGASYTTVYALIHLVVWYGNVRG